MKKLSNKEMLENIFSMSSKYRSKSKKTFDKQKYIEEVKQEVDTALNQYIYVPTFLKDLFLDNSLKDIQEFQIKIHMIPQLRHLRKRLSIYKCHEKYLIQLDKHIDSKTKKELSYLLDKYFRKINSIIRIAIATLETDVSSLRLHIENNTLNNTPVAINGSYKIGIRVLRNEIENDMKSIICNSIKSNKYISVAS